MGATGAKPLRLRTLLEEYSHTAALKNGTVHSGRIAFDFADYKPIWDGFHPMVREGAFDFSEMAIVTYLIAKSFGKPMVLLPAVMTGRFQQPYAVYNAERGVLTPADLPGRRVGIRSFTTTTGAWLRGILANDYGVDLDSVHWVTFEEPHVAEYEDRTERAPAGKTIIGMLLAGELDAVLGDTSSDPRVRCLFGDPAAAAQAWYEKHGVLPINHMVVVSEELAQTRPDIVAELFCLLATSKKLGKPAGHPDPARFGIEAIRRPLDMIIDYAVQQHLIPRRFTVEELFDDNTRRLGS